MQKILLLFLVLFSFSFLYSDLSTEDTLSILNEDDCYNTGNCHYRFTFATDYYSFSPAVSNSYEIVVNVLDPENVWHNYYKTVAQCAAEGVCDAVTVQYIDFWFQHSVSGNQYIAVEIFGNDDDAYDYLYHDVLIDYCYGVNCGTGGTCDGTSGYPVCTCEEGYVLRGGICEEGWFEDENLAAAIVELLQYEGYNVETGTDIEPEMLTGIEYLSLRHRNISSLVGIELFPSLAVLDISENNISDLSPLANCGNLVVLNMSANPASDLSPLSALPLVSLDVSYSGVYNFNTISQTETLMEIIFADSLNGKHGMIRPDGIGIGLWLNNLNLLGCNELIPIYGSVDNTYHIGVVGVSGGCPAHGSCVEGRCVCDEGYEYSGNKCFDPYDCGDGYHYDSASGSCESNKFYIKCSDDEESHKTFPNNYLVWNGSEYVFPEGYTNTELCKIDDETCDNFGSRSLCRWTCQANYTVVQDVCVPNNTTRFIPPSAFNQLIFPNISRQDVVLEPIPGIPSFAPVMKAVFYYDERKLLKSGWYFDLPRVELNINNHSPIGSLFAWDQKTVHVYMPWGREEYSIVAEKKCFDSDNDPLICKTSNDLSNADHVEITYYPAPGQNLFSYVVLETTGDACKISWSHTTQGKYFATEGIGRDIWKITRYGNDGSVTEFRRGAISMIGIDPIPPDPIPVPRDATSFFNYASRPANYRFMDYIPISKYTTRDKKVTSFQYNWHRINYDNEFSHYSIASLDITDPLKRVVRIESDSAESGLTGKPELDTSRFYSPLEGKITVSVGKGDTLKKAAEYDFEGNFLMEATIYKDENTYRRDKYSKVPNYEKRFELESTNALNELKGETVWDFTAENNKPTGYTERKLINSDTPEYAVKTVKGTFYQGTQWKFRKPYALYLPENESERHKITAIYSDGTDKTRIVEDYFTNWLQPAKRVRCKPRSNEDEDCTDNATAVTEEIKYNVQGSPIYFRNADGQTIVNLYNTTDDVSPENYMKSFMLNPSGYNLHKYGTLACSAVYSLDTNDDDLDDIFPDYIVYGIDHNSNWCINSNNRRVTNYEWTYKALEEPHDVREIIYPDGKTRSFTYDYDMINDGVGKVVGETIVGSSNENTIQTCYEYDENYQLIAQGIGTPGSCNPKKGFDFDSTGLLMTQDFSYNEDNLPVLENDYIYDYLGRKLVERNSAGVSTVYVYDSLDRVVFTFFGCSVDPSAFTNRVYEPYNFDGSDSAGENGIGVLFDFTAGQFPYARYIDLESCEYYRKYKYDEMSNLVETYFFEYWGIDSNSRPEKDLEHPKIIKQKTEYDMLGRAVKSCQFDVAQSSDKRCIETEHDAFGNITRKTENGEERIITYDLRNRPLTVTVDGLQTEEYSYNNAAAGGYFGYDTIKNKYENIEPLKTYKDKWGRAAKSVDPFGNNVEPHYNSTTWLTDYSKTYNGAALISFDAYEYDDLGRTTTVKKVLFDTESNTSNAAVASISGIAAKEMVLEKSVSYDSVTGSVVSIADSFGNETVKVYDSLNRVVKVENYDADSQLVSSVRTAYDTTGRISAVQDWTSAKTTVTEYDYDKMGRVIATCVKTANVGESQNCLSSSCNFDNDVKCSYQLYNTGGQVVWSADIETGGSTGLLTFLENNLIVGNETVYDYNPFGEVVKTARRMTANGSGGGLTETQLYNSDAWITTNYTYDIFGRNTEKTDDNGAKTQYTYTANNLPATEKYCGSDDSDCASPREVTYTYNSKRDLVSETYEQEGISLTVNYGRDAFGRISQKYTGTTANDVYQTFTYNMRNLLETAKSVDPTNTSSTLSEVTRTYDSFGNIKSETFDSGTVSSAIAWNPTTKVMSETITLPSGKEIVETTLKGLPETLEYDGAKLLQYNYGTGNVLTSIRKNFDLQDNHAAELYYTYNNWRKVSRRTEEFTAQNAPTVADYEYTYSKGLHLIGKQENEENRRTAYQYDSYYRLRRVDYDCAYSSSDPTCATGRNNVFKCNQSETDCEDFQLDGVHNIRASRENQTDFSWTVDGFNRLTQKSWNNESITYTYDSNNNMISEDVDGDQNADIAYTYDKLNRLTSVTNSDYLVEYSYDPFNRRTEKTVYYTENSDTFERTHKYAYDGWDIISEEIKTLRTSDNPVTTTVWELRRYVDHGTDNHIIMDKVQCSDDGNGNCSPNESTLQRIWFHKDERGNVIAVSDGNGTIYERYRYRVYGEHEVLNADFTPKTTAAISPFLWGGSLYEPETGLYWMRNRYYHIDMHRFINQDPIGIWGDANNLGNGFAYVAGMVIEASDPTGLDTNIGATGNDGLGFGYYSSASNSESASKLLSFVTLGTSAVGLGGEIAVSYVVAGTAAQSVALTFAQANVIASTVDLLSGIISTFFIPDLNSKAHLISVFGEENTEIIVALGNQLAESIGAKGFYYKDNGDGTVELTAVGKDGKEAKQKVNLEEEKLKRDLEQADKFEEEPTSKEIDLKNIESSSIDTNNERSVDPDSGEDMFQRHLRSKMLKMRLKIDDNSNQDKPLIVIETDTPIGKTKIVVHNPYYKNIDPLKRLMKGQDPNSRTLIFNPFLPPESTEYRNTYEKMTQGGGIIMPNVDPYLW